MVERLLARVRARSLDDRLLDGALPEESAQLRARTALLLDPRHRSAAAGALREMVEAAVHVERNFFRAQIQLREPAIVAVRPLILDLADELESDKPVSPRGVILADRLIRDGDSLMYWRSPAESSGKQSVEAAVERARAALRVG